VVIAVKTPEGLPLAYGVLPGNTPDMTTCAAFSIASKASSKAQRIRAIDRNVRNEAVLEGMRGADPPVCYLVGT
jgi:hypothetical protein